MIQKELKRIIKNETGIDLNDSLVLKSQRREYVETRGMYCSLLRELTNITLVSISKSLTKDHTTVMYAIKNFDYWKKSDVNLENSYLEIKESFSKYLKLKETSSMDELRENYLDKYKIMKEEYRKLYSFYEKSKDKNKPQIENFVDFL